LYYLTKTKPYHIQKMQSEKQNLIYLYDLPKKEVDSKKIAIVFKK